MQGQPLMFHESEKIEFYVRGRVPIRTMAIYLKRDHSVIVRELHRNRSPDGKYRAKVAQDLYEKRLGKPHRRKLDTRDTLRNYVITKLQEGWSPEQVSGVLKNRPGPVEQMIGETISHESIYQYIYEGEGRFLGLYQYLPKKKRKRSRKQYRKSRKNGGIIGMTPIKFRPVSEGPGDWESDSIVSSISRACLSIQYEPTFMFTRIWKTEDKSAEATDAALELTIQSLPREIFRSFTFDRGTEGANHWKLRLNYNIDTFHCDPYCSWQKPHVENTNGLIRRYIPKLTNIDLIPSYVIKTIEHRLNNRPRKKLGWKTPNQALEDYLKSRDLVH